MNTKILILGAKGQLGSELTPMLQQKYGLENVIASDIKEDKSFHGIFETLDASNQIAVIDSIQRHKITQIYHLAAILSAKGEENPLITWDLNMKTWLVVLEAARLSNIEKVFYPSSIAVYQKKTPIHKFSEDYVLEPNTVYGMSKVAGEHWANYYYKRYHMDIRSIRFPGIIGYRSLPGGGTTDYAVDIFHKAIQEQEFMCFLNKNEKLPMIFMEDAIRATLEIMEAPAEAIKIKTSYPISCLSFSPIEIYDRIRSRYPGFQIIFEPDHRQQIAENWPDQIDDNQAAQHWGWKPSYTLDMLVDTMLTNLEKQYSSTSLQRVN